MATFEGRIFRKNNQECYVCTSNFLLNSSLAEQMGITSIAASDKINLVTLPANTLITGVTTICKNSQQTNIDIGTATSGNTVANDISGADGIVYTAVNHDITGDNETIVLTFDTAVTAAQLTTLSIRVMLEMKQYGNTTGTMFTIEDYTGKLVN